MKGGGVKIRVLGGCLFGLSNMLEVFTPFDETLNPLYKSLITIINPNIDYEKSYDALRGN